MYNVILGFLKGENVSSVLSVEEVSFQELSCMEIRYVKGERCYLARVYFTVAWISMSPLGPVCNTFEHGAVQEVHRFEDIAEIQQYSSMLELRKAAKITKGQLEVFYNALDRQATLYANRVFCNSDCEVVTTRFCFLPSPRVIAAMAYQGAFLGAISVEMTGQIDVVSCYDNRIYNIVESLRVKALNPAKEFDCYGE